MAVLLLASDFGTSDITEKRERFITPLTNKNLYLDQIKKFVKKFDRVVMVANNPALFEMNDERAHMHFQSLEMTWLHFKEKIILDNRNKEDSHSILEGTDLVLLNGGKLVCQLKFFKEIGLGSFIQEYEWLIIGASAWAMTLCEYMTDFPEYLHEVDDREIDDYIIEGLGFHNEILIPHFDGKNFGRSYLNEGINHVKDYILPLSKWRELLGIPDGSYILLHNGKKQYFGDFFQIKEKKVMKIKKK